MPVLAFDSATTYLTAAVVRGDRVLAESVSEADAGAARRVLAEIDAVLAAAGVTVGELRGIAVGAGPGSFTGLRIGIATARALGDAAGVPVASVATLTALQAGAPAGALAVIDARRGEVFASGPGLAAGAYAPSALPRVRAGGTAAVGDGAQRYRDVLEAAGYDVPPDDDPVHAPSATIHARLASFDGTPAAPLYLREPDARERTA